MTERKRQDEQELDREVHGSVTTASATESDDERTTPAHPGIGGGTPGGGRPGEGDVSRDSHPKRPR